MAAIGKIREKSTLLLVFLGVAMAAFVFDASIFNNDSPSDRYVGEIDGTPILPQEYSNLVQSKENLFKMTRNKNSLTEQEQLQIKDQVWNELLEENLIYKRCDELGLGMSEEESEDLVYGRFIYEGFYQYFGDRDRPGFVLSWLADSLNPRRLDGAKVKAYYDNMLQSYQYYSENNNSAGANDIARQLNTFNQLQQEAIKARIKSKYFNLVKKGMYVNSLDAKADNFSNNSKVDVRIVGKRYDVIPDSTIVLSESEIQNYYEENIKDYPQDDEFRNVAFVKFDIFPSAKDSAEAMDAILSAKSKLAASNEDLQLLCNAESNVDYPVYYFSKDEISAKLDVSAPFDTVIFDNTAKDSIIGPFVDRIAEKDGSSTDYYKIAKVVDKQKRPDSVKFRYILIAHEELERVDDSVTLTFDQAKFLADSLVKEIRRDSSQFGDLAMKFSNHQSKYTKGELGWILDVNQNVPEEIIDLCIKSPKGAVDTIISEMGIQIIQVLDKTKAVDKVKLAMINKRIVYSSETKKLARNKANELLDNIETIEAYQNFDFMGKNIRPQNADNLSSTSYGIGNVKESRRVVEWAFNAEVGETDVINLDDSYIFAILTEIKEKGYKPLDDVRMEVEAKLRIEKKADMIISEAGSLSDINEYANAFEANIDSITGQTFRSSYVKGIGSMEYDLIGAMFAYDEGETSKPIKSANGVYVFVVDKKHEPAELTDVEQSKANILRGAYYSLENDLFNALKKSTEIIDNRILVN